MAVIGTAGHVDHGKSSLVHALTGIDPDRLREEKERGLTIDLGFAWLTLPSGEEVGIVDVPGHERFIKNMLAGAGGMDLALLVVAADEGPRPQTAEHLAILDLLEIPAGLVVITKCDLVEPEYADLVEAEVEDTLKGSRLEGVPILRVSAATGEGLPELRAAIDAALASTEVRRDLGRARLPVDRAFTVQGFGAVVTGTLLGGTLTVGQEVELQPGGMHARVRGLQRHHTKAERLEPGSRAAVNLSGIRAEDLRRGMVLAGPGVVGPVVSMDVRLRASSILAHPVRHDALLTVLSATAEAQGKLRLLDTDELQRGGECWAQLVLEAPMAALPGDHVVLRTPNETVAGGRIVALHSRRHRRNHQPTLNTLERALAGAPATRLLDLLLSGPETEAVAAARLGLTSEEAGTAVGELRGVGEVELRGGQIVAKAWLASRGAALAALAETFLTASPLRRAAPREHLRSAMQLPPAQFDLLVTTSVESGMLEVRGAGLSPAGYEPQLSAGDQLVVDRFLNSLKGGRFSPPTDSLPSVALLAFLAERGDIVDTGAGVVFDAGVFEEMVTLTRRHIETHGAISMAEARDLFGNSRKYAQAFLEYLDARRVTRRNGDSRTLLA